MISLKEIQEYREHPAYSQSDLKFLLSKGTRGFKPSLTTLIGSYLDCKLTCSHLSPELYFVCDVERPTNKIVELCDSFYNWMSDGFIYDKDIPQETDLTKYELQVEQWIQFQDYYSNRPKTRVEKFIKEAREWWSVLVQKGEREIITTVEEIETEIMVMNLLNDYNLSWLWKGECQKPFYWEEEGVSCKGLGDIVLPNVYVDLKYTTCPTLNEWWKVCSNLNYPFQMAFYKSGLGVSKCYWLVVNKNWYELIEVTDLMLTLGKWGYDKYEKIRVGKIELEVNRHTNGYMDGLNLINGTERQFNYLDYI